MRTVVASASSFIQHDRTSYTTMVVGNQPSKLANFAPIAFAWWAPRAFPPDDDREYTCQY
jgi:hypothetical protein